MLMVQFRKWNEIVKMAAEKLSSLTVVQLYQDAIICSRVCYCASTVSRGAVNHRWSHHNFRGTTDGPHS